MWASRNKFERTLRSETAALAGAQQAAAAQQSRASAASSTAIGSASVDANSGGEDAGSGLTFELLESTFGCTQLAPPVAVAGATGGASELSGMTQTDGTVLDEIDVRDGDFIGLFLPAAARMLPPG